MSTPLRVVLDTNVVLSALVFGGGLAGRLRLAWQRGLVLPLASTATAQELVRVLTYPKFRLSLQEQGELLADYLPYVKSVRIPQPPPPVPDCRDPMDAPFLHLAVAGRARAPKCSSAPPAAPSSASRLSRAFTPSIRFRDEQRHPVSRTRRCSMSWMPSRPGPVTVLPG
jgi:putative PIN family toxin of toxin-antitoxin system